MLTFVMMSRQKKIILSVSNDLHTDQRLHKVCISLQQQDHEVCLLGRFTKDSSKDLIRPYAHRRFRLLFNKGPLFYLNLNLRLFFYLLFNSFDLLIANDLDTLPANFLVSRIRRKPLVYDSHEYFTEVPELVDRPSKRRIWERIESFMLPKIKHAYTVSPSIANAYFEKYGLKMAVVRNFPIHHPDQGAKETPEKVVIYQGALNLGRGIEELIKAFSNKKLQEAKLWLFGKGDKEMELKALCHEVHAADRIIFWGRKEGADLREYTRQASLGVSLEHPLGLSYQYAIPNEVFDYLHAGVPVLYSPLKELEALLNDREVGQKLRSHQPEALAEQISEMLNSRQLAVWRKNALTLAEEYCWQKEEKKLLAVLANAFEN